MYFHYLSILLKSDFLDKVELGYVGSAAEEGEDTLTENQLAHRLAELSGHLSVPEGTPVSHLDNARRVLAEALLNGQAEPMETPLSKIPPLHALDDLPDSTIEELRKIAHDLIPTQRDPAVRLFRRQWPLVSAYVEESALDWSRGWALESSFGPFEDIGRRLVWFDLRRTLKFVLVIETQTGRILLALPIGSQLTPGGTNTIEVPPGTVWMSAPLFDASLAGWRLCRCARSRRCNPAWSARHRSWRRFIRQSRHATGA